MRRVLWIIVNVGQRTKTQSPVAPEVLVKLLPDLDKLIQLDDEEVLSFGTKL